MKYKLVIQPEVFDDIQEAIDWYNTRQSGLGKKFSMSLKMNSTVCGHFQVFKYDTTMLDVCL